MMCIEIMDTVNDDADNSKNADDDVDDVNDKDEDAGKDLNDGAECSAQLVTVGCTSHPDNHTCRLHNCKPKQQQQQIFSSHRGVLPRNQ